MFHQWMKTYAGEDRDWCEVMDDGDAGEERETEEEWGEDYVDEDYVDEGSEGELY